MCNTSTTLNQLIDELRLPKTLSERLYVTKNGVVEPPHHFVLYVPTVCLRKRHNPAFALACHLANKLNVPLLVLCVVADDSHLLVPYPEAVVGTARRLAFTLQALQKATLEWQQAGSSVLIRVHTGSATSRTPHHLTLACRASLVVCDEPFVHPYRCLTERIERAARASVRVDGSTTVPPVCILRKISAVGDGSFQGVPPKAWMWEKMTHSRRKAHVYGAVKDGHLDAPELNVKWQGNPLSKENPLSMYFPVEWLSDDEAVSAPDKRPWTVQELQAIPIEEWSLAQPEIDSSVPPCQQTHGARGWERWEYFVEHHLSAYAKRRNNILLPHSVSRMSCYLNLGTVSIFDCVYQLMNHRSDTQKFRDEIIKWREIGYAHAFSTPDYFSPSTLPKWALAFLQNSNASLEAYKLETLVMSQTTDPTWNEMQTYLRDTGELHNNARMTWGKTVVQWQKGLDVKSLMMHMSYLNDRYALDGLSPPSYAGLLWCLGWCDKPASGQSISTKPASRYRFGPDGFRQAKLVLLQGGDSVTEESSPQNKKLRRDEGSQKSIASFFGPVKAKATKVVGCRAQ